MISTEFTVWCESEGCSEWYQECHSKNITKAIVSFKKLGWKKVNGKWLCNKH